MVGKKRKKDRQAKEQATAQPKRLTPVEIQQKEFRVAMRGYHEQDVDRFLDEVTEEVARLYADNKRLREDLELTGTARLDVGVAAEADAILRRARDEADRIIAEARAAAGRGAGSATFSSGPAGGRSADLGPFISRERDFLQGLANLIQSHAEAVKQDLRRTREPMREDPLPSSGPAPSSGVGSEPADRGAASSRDAERDAGTQIEDRADHRLTPTMATRTATHPETPERAEPDDILDLTQGDVDTRLPHQAEPQVALEPPSVAADDDEDRSLRELFWGED
jgi:DivIVA domain-containing protein